MCFFLLKASYLGWSSYDQEALREAQNGKQCGRQLCHMGVQWCLYPVDPSGVLQTPELEASCT